MPVAVSGVNHRTAPIEVRERFHVAGRAREEAVAWLRDASDVEECVVLSTCNRTEYYFYAPGAGTGVEEVVVRAMARPAGLPARAAREYVYFHREYDCVVHLYRVVAGLDSLVVGEPQIQGQVRDAYRRARERPEESVGPVLHRLFQSAQAAGGEVRSRTKVSQGAASVPSAAVELAGKVFGSLEGRTAMVLGAGKMGEMTLRCLRDEGVEGILVASRTLGHARQVSGRVGGTAIPYPEFWDRLPEVDVVVTSTSAPHPIVTAERLRTARAGGGPVVVLDIALPRNVEPAAGDLQNVFLYNIDDLQRVVEQTERVRAGELPAAGKIVEEHGRRFWRWYRAREAVPVIRGMREHAERIRRREIETALERMEGLSEADRERIHMATRAALNKILHRPTTALREMAQEEEGAELLEAARRLFPADGRDEEEGR